MHYNYLIFCTIIHLFFVILYDNVVNNDDFSFIAKLYLLYFPKVILWKYNNFFT